MEGDEVTAFPGVFPAAGWQGGSTGSGCPRQSPLAGSAAASSTFSPLFPASRPSLLPSQVGQFHKHDKTQRWCPLPNFLALEHNLSKFCLSRVTLASGLKHVQALALTRYVLDFLMTLSLGMVRSIRKVIQPEVKNVTTHGECPGPCYAGWSVGVPSLPCLQYVGATAEVPKSLYSHYFKVIDGEGGSCDLCGPVNEASFPWCASVELWRGPCCSDVPERWHSPGNAAPLSSRTGNVALSKWRCSLILSFVV